MTPYEMEEQLKNLDARTTAIEHILPTLATKDDLRLRTEALQEDLRLATAALQHEMAKLATKDELNAGLEDAKRYTLMLNEATWGVSDLIALLEAAESKKEPRSRTSGLSDVLADGASLRAMMAEESN